jgi:hypothetical protein
VSPIALAALRSIVLAPGKASNRMPEARKPYFCLTAAINVRPKIT